MRSRIAFAATVFSIAAGIAYAAQTVTVIGPVTPNDCAAFFSTTQIKDAGVNCSSGGGGTGTVTSVGLSLPGTVFNVTGTPVTNNGTLTGTFFSQSANTAFLGPLSSPPAAPAFRTISGADLPFPSALTIGGVLANGPVTSSYVFAVTTTGGTLIKQPQFGELTGTAAPGQLPVATNTTYGATETVSQVTSNWINGYINGIPQLSQPLFTDIAGTIATSQLPSSGNNTVLSNISGSTGSPSPNSLTAVFDAVFGAVQGAIVYRNNTQWVELTPGVNGQVLTTSGANNNPLWTTVTGTGTMTSIFPAPSIFMSSNPCNTSCVVSVASSANNTLLANTSGGSAPPVATSPSTVLDIFGTAPGNILTRGSGVWTALAPGTSGTGTTQQFLKTNGPGSTPSYASVSLTNVTSSTVVNIALPNGSYADGPTVTQGTSGVWSATGKVTLSTTTAGGEEFYCKLWDGTTVIDSGSTTTFASGTNNSVTMSLSGVISSPAANIRISCAGQSVMTGTMNFNITGNSKDSTVTAVRIQ